MQKLIPPFLFLLSVFIMIGLDFFYPNQQFVLPPFTYLGIPLALIGLSLTIWVRKLFEQKNTEIHTFKTPRTLVRGGPFKFSRNPIYLGFIIALLGVGLFLGNIISLLTALVFFLITNFWYIPFEEKLMEQIFKNEYLDYKSRVRRWL